jgi:hypothetical protein
MVLLSAQGMNVAGITKVTFTSPDRVREVINNFNGDGFDSLYPRYAGGRPPTFTLPQRQAIKKSARRGPRITACRFRPRAWPSWPSSWSLRGWSMTARREREGAREAVVNRWPAGGTRRARAAD